MKRIFVNGTFDVLHCGHLDLLNYAASLGDCLLVALDSDERVSKLKGPTRPINNTSTRLAVISNLKAVSEVKSFSSDEELSDIIKQYSPDIMVVGSDWKGKRVVGSEYVGKLEFYERTNPASTTGILENYMKRISENKL